MVSLLLWWGDRRLLHVAAPWCGGGDGRLLHVARALPVAVKKESCWFSKISLSQSLERAFLLSLADSCPRESCCATARAENSFLYLC